jgi:hypothetical protein
MAKKEAKKKAPAKTAVKKKTKTPAKKAKAATKTAADPAAKDAKAKPKTKAKRKSRAGKDVKVRQRLAWAVFNHAMKPVAKYAFNQRKAADKKARELSPEGKPPHFVARIKEEITEE